MLVEHPRLKRERKTIHAMMSIYCRELHGTGPGLCAKCQGLHDYAMQRLERCVFQDQKPTCVNCPVHCYKKDQREMVRVVMRYAGPKMMLRHPILAVLHLVDGRRKAPGLPKRKGVK